jgi:hypothetical protein
LSLISWLPIIINLFILSFPDNMIDKWLREIT